MSRYIDVDKIEYAPCTVYEHNGKDVTEMIAYKKLIDIMPTADVEEVVRCKDCVFGKNFDNNEIYRCATFEHFVYDDSFCSFAKRRGEK